LPEEKGIQESEFRIQEKAMPKGMLRSVAER
jgi:hypothetical protein